jgi:ABC-type sugar transport system ATPase subunit
MNLVPAHVVDAGGADRIVGFRPEHIEVGPRRGDGMQFTASIEVVEYLGDEQIAHLLVKDTPMVAKLPVEDKVTAGQNADFTVAQDKLRYFDAETQARIR